MQPLPLTRPVGSLTVRPLLHESWLDLADIIKTIAQETDAMSTASTEPASTLMSRML
jgi:hypothetical protein